MGLLGRRGVALGLVCLGQSVERALGNRMIAVFLQDAPVPGGRRVGPAGSKKERVGQLVPGHRSVSLHLRLASRVARDVRKIEGGHFVRRTLVRRLFPRGRLRGIRPALSSVPRGRLGPADGSAASPVVNTGAISPGLLKLALPLLYPRRIVVKQEARIRRPRIRRRGSVLALLCQRLPSSSELLCAFLPPFLISRLDLFLSLTPELTDKAFKLALAHLPHPQ